MALAGPELEGYLRIGGGGAGACCDRRPRALDVGGNDLLASCGLSKWAELLSPSLECPRELLDDDYQSEKISEE